MRKLLYSIQLMFLLAITCSLQAQKSNYPNTLLWRITGKNLKSPSYLFGTMHLQDKRLFNFGDSLYAAIEKADGLAIEINFQDYMDSMFRTGIERGRDEMLARQKVKLDKTKLDKSADSLFKKLNIDKTNLTKKDLKRIREYRTNQLLQKGEMPTIVDGYLFGLAARQNKWTGGIEDVEDQMNIDDEIGGELSPENVFVSDKLMKQGLEHMVQIYVNEDLQAIDDYTNHYDAEARDVILIKRNIKMARRMDSLANIRTMFFAVGVAHLPGDSGVITLLRERGFTVEPVFSSKKIAANEYAKKLQAIPWYKVQDENKLYTVEMPGNPSKFDEFGQALQMKIYFDITSMTFYMAGQTIGMVSGSQGFEEMFRQMAKRMGAEKQLPVKNVSFKGIEARETVFENEGISFKVRLIQKDKALFLLMAGSMNPKGISSNDVTYFFNSFVAHDVLNEEKPWVQFSMPEKAVSLKLPGEPKRNTSFDKSSEGTAWEYTSYDLADNSNGLYYLIQVRDIKDGYYLENDSLYFESYLEDVKTRMDTVFNIEYLQHDGFPAMRADMLYNKSYRYSVFLIIRGGRIYLTMLGGAADHPLSQAKTLFESLKLETYLPSTWTKQHKAGFSTLTPVPFSNQVITDSASKQEQYTAYNSKDAVAYHIFKQPYKPYYWISSDSALFDEKVALYSDNGDSVISRKEVFNGTHKALELLVHKNGLNNVQKLRILVNRDTLYTLSVLIPRQYANEKQHQQFFDNFIIEQPIAPTIFKNKAKELLQALKSADSTTFEEAALTFQSMKFERSDLPFLHQLVLENLRDSAEYDNIQERAMKQIADLADPATINFVQKHYVELANEKEHLKCSLLWLLAENKTEQSYTILKQLLLQAPPKNGKVYRLASSMLDSLELVKRIYPELITLSSDSVFSDALARISLYLLDTAMITLKDLEPYKMTLIEQANRKFLEAKKSGEEDDWWYYDWTKLLQALNDENANKLLQQLSASKSIDLQYEATVALLKNKQNVLPAVMNKLAADKYYRLELYSYLEGLQELKLFPATFKNQKAIAESELYQLASDDYEPSKIDFLGEKMATFQGQKKKFYLFKVQYTYEEGTESYLGVTGPYDIETKQILRSTKASGLVSESWDAKKMEQQFKQHLKSIEEYYEENGEE